MSSFVIVQSGRYGNDWKDAPSLVTIHGGDLKLAEHVARSIQEWRWPGQEEMFEVHMMIDDGGTKITWPD